MTPLLPVATFLAHRGATDHVQRVLAPLLHGTQSSRGPSDSDAAHLEIASNERSITVTRGGFGGRPAYIRELADVMLVSSSMAWMVGASNALGAKVTLDPDVLAMHAFCMDASAPTRSLFREITVVATGTRAEVTEGKITISDLAPPAPITTTAPPAAELRARLIAAVERATRGARRVGVMTGGGVDSSALLALAHARTDLTVNAFAIDFAGPGDDRPHLATIARALSLTPHRLAPTDAELPAQLTADALPLMWTSAAAEAALLSRARSWGADRVLCGLFADALFDVDPPTWKDTARALATTLAPPSMLALARRARKATRGTSSSLALSGVRVARLRKWQNVQKSFLPRRDEASARIRSAFFSAHLAAAADLRAQEEAIGGLVRLDPYLDADLATYVLSLPRAVVAAGAEDGIRRGLFRAALAGVLPESIRTRPDKASFAALHAAFFRPPFADLLRRYASFEALGDLGIVDPLAARTAFTRAIGSVAEAERHGADLYALLVAESFARAHASEST